MAYTAASSSGLIASTEIIEIERKLNMKQFIEMIVSSVFAKETRSRLVLQVS
ncbi:unnamed protein product [Acanthoscelides obtectus]|uniref:Uncharacterized protein n=1 Tax=Acanthoscelides obtectus TaxID=200917 RepID=A0A9P0L6I6_ACAOB|nr:unnamed protein product [Acanthoscelides obtectus]CAK1633058.1 hypothetical protein AOBTE_LOCUS7913 [Acanthoscelides obtectus]